SLYTLKNWINEKDIILNIYSKLPLNSKRHTISNFGNSSLLLFNTINKPRNEDAQEGTRQSEKDSKFYNFGNSSKNYNIEEIEKLIIESEKTNKINTENSCKNQETENSQFIEQYNDLKKKMQERQILKQVKRRNTKKEIINYKSFRVFEKISEDETTQISINNNNIHQNNNTLKNTNLKKLNDKRTSIKPLFDPEIDLIMEEFSQEVSSFVDDSYSNLKLEIGNDGFSKNKVKKEHANTAVPELPMNKISDCIDEVGDKCRTVISSPNKQVQQSDNKGKSKLSKLFSKDSCSPQKEIKIVVKEQNITSINDFNIKDSTKLKDKRLSYATKSTTSEHFGKNYQRDKVRQNTASTEATVEKFKPFLKNNPKLNFNLEKLESNELHDRRDDLSMTEDKSKILVSDSVINNIANQSSFYSSHFRNSADYNSQININSNLSNNIACNSNNFLISQINNKSRGSQDFHKNLFEKKSSSNNINNNSNFFNKKHRQVNLPNSQNSTFLKSMTVSSTSTNISNTNLNVLDKRESLSSSSNANLSGASVLKRNSKASSSLNSVKYVSKDINIVDILNSKDARTTIMIRHIPNKYTIEDLVYEIDEHFYGKYTYINLPLDYSVSIYNKLI
ncbi:MAG: hypothetical protein ACK5YA_01260, partial [bacterium]